MPTDTKVDPPIKPSVVSPDEMDRMLKHPDGETTLLSLVAEGYVDLDEAARAIVRAGNTGRTLCRRILVGVVDSLLGK